MEAEEKIKVEVKRRISEISNNTEGMIKKQGSDAILEKLTKKIGPGQESVKEESSPFGDVSQDDAE